MVSSLFRRVTHISTKESQIMSFVHAPSDPGNMTISWDSCFSLNPQGEPWVMIGDFSEYLHKWGKWGCLIRFLKSRKTIEISPKLWIK